VQETAQNVLENERAEISDVGVVVDSGAASVDAHFALVERLQRLQAVGQRVVKLYLRHFRGNPKR
jgi:hypothetical protein